MKIKKFSGFNEYGYLPEGVYNMTLDEIERVFSKNNSRRILINLFGHDRKNIKKGIIRLIEEVNNDIHYN